MCVKKTEAFGNYILYLLYVAQLDSITDGSQPEMIFKGSRSLFLTIYPKEMNTINNRLLFSRPNIVYRVAKGCAR